MICFLLFVFSASYAQQKEAVTFKAGWKTYNLGMMIHEYTYNYTHTDSARLYVTDSAKTYVSTDSMISMVLSYRYKDKTEYKTIYYLNSIKQTVKSEIYKDDILQETNDWKYDEKNRISIHLKTNNIAGNSYKKVCDYSTDKKTGELVTYESSYYNGKIEFYTRYYYNSKNQLYKEVRLNDNNKDIVHTENFVYGENGKVSERAVYFPEFKVTKKFDEPAGKIPPACFAMMPMGTIEKANLKTRIAYIKRVIQKNLKTINNPNCKSFEYTFTNKLNCNIIIATTKVNNGRTVVYQFKEKIQ